MMREHRQDRGRTAVVVIGCDEIGSAIAHTLHRSGAAVVLIDDIDPPWARRGRSYVDAWYVGGATLDQVDACFCASVKSIPELLARGDMIAATTWSLESVANVVGPSAIVETRAASRMQLPRSRPPFLDGTRMIGVHGTRVAGWPADIVIAGEQRPVGRAGAANGSDGDADPSGAMPLRIEAPCKGRFRTRHEISECVEPGTVLGELGGFVAIAPVDGVLTALSARGARVTQGDLLLEIDPSRDVRRCFGITKQARDLAQHVNAVVRRANSGGSSAGSVAPPAQLPARHASDIVSTIDNESRDRRREEQESRFSIPPVS